MGYRQVSGGIGKSKRSWHRRIRRRIRLDYFRVLRTRGAPAQVARGVGYGIFVELIFFPTLGLGFVLMYPLNRWCRGHWAASIAGFVFAKLFAWATIPPSIILGKALIGSERGFVFVTESFTASIDSLKRFYTEGLLWEFLLAWIIGAAIFGVILGLVGFVICLKSLKGYQNNRRAVLRENQP